MKYDVIVIGGGHAGAEAALASARLNHKTLLICGNEKRISNMPCNPSIGGPAKGILVREIDALGGEMGRAADKCFIQSRMLNRGRGPAVHSLRAQADRKLFHTYMKRVCESEPLLDIKQAEVAGIIVEDNCIKGIRTNLGAVYHAKAVIIATGTYLKGKVIIGPERGVLDYLAINEENGDRFIQLAPEKLCCEDMKKITLEDVYKAIIGEGGEKVELDEDLRKKALKSINRMLELG